MYAQRRDANEAEIIDALRGAGASVKQMDRLAGFDLLVGYMGRLYVLEVKTDPRERLTQAEALYRQELAWQGIIYHVVYSPERALDILGLVEEVME